MKKKNIKARRRIRVYLIAIVGLLSFFAYKMFYYWPKIFDNYKSQEELAEKYDVLLEEEEELTSEVIKLQDEEYIARYAREKYLYSKEGEIIIRIVE